MRQDFCREKRLAAALLFVDDLQQNRAGQVIAAGDVNDLEFLALYDELAKIRDRDVTADFGIVKPPVGILLDGTHGDVRPGLLCGAIIPPRDREPRVATIRISTYAGRR